MQAAQVAPRLDAQLLDECRTGRAIRLERFGLAAGAVEREHELAAQSLAVRVLGDEGLELAHHPGVLPERQLPLDPLLDAGEAKLLEPCDLRGGEPVRGEVGEGRAAPQRKRLVEPPRRAQALELGEVELVVLDCDQVPGRLPLQALVTDRLAQLGHVDVQRFVDRLGWVVLPEQVDQPVAGHDAVALEQQRGEQRTLLGPAQVERSPIRADLEGTQDAEVHARPTLRSPSDPCWRRLGSVDRGWTIFVRICGAVALLALIGVSRWMSPREEWMGAPEWFKPALDREAAPTA